MFYIYLSALIFGGSFLLMSLLLGDHDGDASDHSALDAGHADIDHDLDAHIDDFDTSTDIEISDADTSHPIQHFHSDATDAVSFISFRNITFFSAFFGLTGLILDFLTIPFFISLFSSIGMGAFAWGFGHKLMKYLKSSQTGEGIDLAELKGRNAIVSLPVSKESKGKIFIRTETSNFEMIAKVSEVAKKDQFNPRDEVLIIEISNNIAYIVESDYS
jgi:hypothetical protein